MTATVAVMGGGAWGTALACVARRTGATVKLWARDAGAADQITKGINPGRLPGITLEDGIAASTDAPGVLDGADCVLLAIPAQSLRTVVEAHLSHLPDGLPVAICAKGIERGSLKRMTEILAEAAPGLRACVLSGPTFAGEVARGLPTAITLAGHDEAALEIVRQAVGRGTLRAYLSDDPIGAEIGGAIKNVIALAAGICTGAGLGENARAALVSRGLAEIMRLAVASGGRRETIMGLSGAGDLILTAMSATSRNTAFGIDLGRGQSTGAALAARRAVVEGYWTTEAAVTLAARFGVEMPICQAAATILRGETSIEEAVKALMDRPASVEFS